MLHRVPLAFDPRVTLDGLRLCVRAEEPGPPVALAATAAAALMLAAGVALLDGDAGLVCGAVAVVILLGSLVAGGQAAYRHEVALTGGMLVVERWWGRWRLRRERLPLGSVRVRLAGDRLLALRVIVLELDDGRAWSMLADAHSLRDSRELVSWLGSRAAEGRARRVAAPEPPAALLALLQRGPGVCRAGGGSGRGGQGLPEQVSLCEETETAPAVEAPPAAAPAAVTVSPSVRVGELRGGGEPVRQ